MSGPADLSGRGRGVRSPRRPAGRAHFRALDRRPTSAGRACWRPRCRVPRRRSKTIRGGGTPGPGLPSRATTATVARDRITSGWRQVSSEPAKSLPTIRKSSRPSPASSMSVSAVADSPPLSISREETSQPSRSSTAARTRARRSDATLTGCSETFCQGTLATTNNTLVEIQRVAGHLGCSQMTDVGRIERPPKDADAFRPARTHP